MSDNPVQVDQPVCSVFKYIDTRMHLSCYCTIELTACFVLILFNLDY